MIITSLIGIGFMWLGFRYWIKGIDTKVSAESRAYFFIGLGFVCLGYSIFFI